MNIYYNLDDIKFPSPMVCTIGFFDGVHKGHRLILSELTKIAKQTNYKSAVITFQNHPQIVLNTKPDLKLITTNEEKIDILTKLNIDNIILLDFDIKFSKISPEDFIKNILVSKLNVSKIIVGKNHYFGKDRTGNYESLRTLSNIYKFDIKSIDIKKVKGVDISSTKIRNMIINGDISSANNALMDSFSISGLVIKGLGMGTKINFPTANIMVKNKHKIMPKNGVYAAKAIIENRTFFGMLNIGFRPTIHKQFGIEIHIFDFRENIYSKNITILILKRIRDEKSFSSIQNLQKQLHLDKSQTLSYIRSLQNTNSNISSI